MIYLLVIISLLLFIVMQPEAMIACGVSDTSLANAFRYVFMHASWLHLLINCVSLLLLWIPVKRIYCIRYNTNTYWLSVFVYASAILAGFACAVDVPTVGMSGCVFFLLGVVLMLNPTMRQLRNYIWVALCTIVQLFFGKSNVPLHLFAFVEGCIYICMREFLYQYTHKTGLFSANENEC